VGAMRNCGQLETFRHIIGVRIAHMGATVPAAAVRCELAPVFPASHLRVDTAASEARGRRLQYANADTSTLFGTLSVCASPT